MMLELWTENYIWPLPRHEGHLLLEPLTFGLEVLNRLQEQLVRVPLACRLDLENEVVPLAAQLDLVRELGVAQALPADGVLHRVLDDRLHLALVALEVRIRLGLLLGDLLQADDALREAPLELLRVGADDGPRDVDERQQAVRGGGDGRELGVVGADALMHVRHELDLLARPQLRDEDVRVHGRDGLVPGKDLGLLADGQEPEVRRVDVGVVEELARVLLARLGVGPARALDVELDLDRIVVHAVLERVLVRAGLLVPLHELVQPVLAALERDEPQPVAENLVLDDARVIVHPDVLDGERGDLGDHDAPEGVGDGGVEPNEAEGGIVLAVLVEQDLELLAKGLEVPRVVLTGVMAGEVGRGDVCDCFCVDVDDLRVRAGQVSERLLVARI